MYLGWWHAPTVASSRSLLSLHQARLCRKKGLSHGVPFYPDRWSLEGAVRIAPLVIMGEDRNSAVWAGAEKREFALPRINNWPCPPARESVEGVKIEGVVHPVSLASLQDHRKIATVGVHCNGCGHRHRWRIKDIIVEHKPRTTGPRSGEAVKCSMYGGARRRPNFVRLPEGRPRAWRAGPLDMVEVTLAPAS